LNVFAAGANLTCDAFESKGDQPVAPTFFLRTLRSFDFAQDMPLRPISESEFSYFVPFMVKSAFSVAALPRWLLGGEHFPRLNPAQPLI